MISITGSVKGKKYDNENVSAEELIKIFGLPIKLEKKSVIFSLLKRHQKPDPTNRRIRHSSKRSLTPTVSGTFEGEYLTIRYYEKVKIGEHGAKTYSPARIVHKGLEMPVDPATGKEMAAFLAVSGYCEDSPIKSNSRKFFKITDKHKDAVKALSQENLLATLIIGINSAHESIIHRLAHAISLSGTTSNGDRVVNRTVSGVSGRSIEGLKTDLIKLAKLLPTEFAAAFNDQELLLRGMLKEAKDKGVIVMENAGSGVTIWRWAKDIDDGAEIIRTRPSQEPYSVLYNHVLSPNAFKYFTDTVNERLQYSEATQKFENIPAQKVMEAVQGKLEIEDMTPIQLVEKAIIEDRLYFDRGAGKVFILKDEEPEAKALHVVVDKKGWKEELAKAVELANIKKNRLIAALKD